MDKKSLKNYAQIGQLRVSFKRGEIKKVRSDLENPQNLSNFASL